ncbi:MAG: LCP family protein [Oscillospiraceae bacterium]|nr:LCP family protein [Oscillospiraceae bacterium]
MAHYVEERPERRQKRMSKGTRVLLTIVIVIVVIALLLGAAVFVLDHFGRTKMTDPEATMAVIEDAELDNAGRVRYKGQLYEYKKDITTILLMGVDSRSKEESEGEFGASNQSDMNVLAVLDPETRQITFINISRDAMVEMEAMDALGNSTGTTRAQLALAYSYGEGGDVSCRLTRDAVSDLFYDLPIHAYASIYLNGVADLVGEIGGITVQSLETFGEFREGETVELTRSNTESYIRHRDHTVDGNNQRMERHKQVLMAVAKAMLTRIREKPISILTTYDAVKRNVTTDLNTGSILYLARTAAGMHMNESVLKVQGESVLGDGNHAEFNVDETALFELILSVFYTPVEG